MIQFQCRDRLCKAFPLPNQRNYRHHSTIVRGIEMKKCRKCGETKPLDGFEKARSCLDGHRATCRVCRAPMCAANAARWRARNPDRAKDVQARYYAKNPDAVKAARKKHYDANADYYREKSRVAYSSNKSRASELNKEWMRRNKEVRAAYEAKYRAENKELKRELYKKWEKANLPARLRINANRRARIAGNGGVLPRGIREKLFAQQKGLCACCGLPLGEKYHLDHIYPISKGGKNTDDNVQLLRRVCNLQKKDKDPVEFMRSRKAVHA